jgi:NAD(P)-dependent dehydrogenase (short-subunit alcohol dehydrogenase family)
MSFIGNRVPAGRAGEPDEIAGLAVFLASAAGSYCTGGIYVADGGFMLANGL